MNSTILNTLANIYALTGLNSFIYDHNLNPVYGYHGTNITVAAYSNFPVESIVSHLSSEDIYRETLDSASQIYLYAIKSAKNIILFGPVAHHVLSSWDIHNYKINHRDTVNFLVNCSESSTYAALSLLIFIVDNKIVSITDLSKMFSKRESVISTESDFVDQQLTQIDTFQLNHTSQSENYFLDLVKKGDVTGMQALLSSTTFLYPTPVKNQVKNQEYMVVSLISLLCRAAISGHVPASIAFAQSDAYLKIISECNTEDEMTAAAHDASITFTKLVLQYQSIGAYSFTGTQCKKLIHSGLLNHITLASLASDLSVSREYLATCFKSDYGITVTHYINKKNQNWPAKSLPVLIILLMKWLLICALTLQATLSKYSKNMSVLHLVNIENILPTLDYNL